jgi:WD40 repeat protein
VASGRLLRTLTGHTESVLSAAFPPDGRTLASGSWDLTIKLWNSASVLRTLTGHANFVDSVAFSPDGRTLASGSWDTTIKLWDSASGQCTR